MSYSTSEKNVPVLLIIGAAASLLGGRLMPTSKINVVIAASVAARPGKTRGSSKSGWFRREVDDSRC